MRICYFGIYDPNDSRNRGLIKGLKENGVEVVQCQVHPAQPFKYWKLFKKHRQIKDYDIMIVGFPGHPAMPLAKLICRKPIIFDAFVSLYDSNIFDRKNASPHSLEALKCWFLDWVSCSLADKVLLDTNEHIKYFVKTFGIRREKFKRVFIGSDDTIFSPKDYQKNTNEFLVLFQRSYSPLHGVEYIIEAAKKLEQENIRFNLFGHGQIHQMAVDLSKRLNVKNVNFVRPIPEEELVKHIARADICLGIFGRTSKARRVIPNKVYDALACRKAVITGESPAERELLKNRENVLFCKMASSKDLAEKILELKNNPELRNKIANNGYKLFKEKLFPRVLGKELKKICLKFLSPESPVF